MKMLRDDSFHPVRARQRLALTLLCLLLSCSTRTPEEPTGNRGTYEPPTTPMLVIDNFRSAVIEKNSQNFMLCLADPSRSRYPYLFEPSAEAGARFQAVFASWSITKEQQAFLSMIARLPSDQNLGLEFENSNIAFASPDSTVWVSDYILTAQLGIASLPTVLNGTLVFSITPEVSGLWSISRWSDAKRPTDTVESTWSLLKAQLSN
ncbi:MAG: hypothetical protein NTX15_01055 [Candidatus Kapabacteria bacterium]|nr:hypothetical protein [Candidatus Kapabacteria bacterium]